LAYIIRMTDQQAVGEDIKYDVVIGDSISLPGSVEYMTVRCK